MYDATIKITQTITHHIEYYASIFNSKHFKANKYYIRTYTHS